MHSFFLKSLFLFGSTDSQYKVHVSEIFKQHHQEYCISLKMGCIPIRVRLVGRTSALQLQTLYMPHILD